MSKNTLCRLCVSAHEEYKSLYDESGQGNQFYEIALKYFDPMLLTPDSEWDATVICVKCWHHINDFHLFQQTILDTQSNLHKLFQADVKENEPEVKIEYILSGVQMPIKEEDTSDDVESISKANAENDDKPNQMPIKEEDKYDDVDSIYKSNNENDDMPNQMPIMEEDTYGHVDSIYKANTANNDMPNQISIKEEDALDIVDSIYKANRENDDMPNVEYYDVEDGNRINTSDDEDDMKPLIFHITKAQKRKRDYNDNGNISDFTKAKKLTKLGPMKKQKVEKVSKLKQKLKKVESASELPQTEGVNQEPDDEDNSNEIDNIEADNSNNGKRSCSDKILEWDNFIAQWKPKLECIHCATAVDNFALLRKHFRSHHPNEKFYAKCCERRFTKRFTLFEHIQLHLNPKVFECRVCGKCCASSIYLAKHTKQLHTEEGKLRPFECSICQKNFTSKNILQMHMELHESTRDHVCSECGKGFLSEQRRKDHERLVHNVDRICDQCGKTVHGIYAFKKHLLEHKGVEKTKWPCDICGAQLNNHSSRTRHKQVKHNDGTIAYICSDCGKVYTSKPALLDHKRMAHRRELKFKCNYCEKAFKIPRYLREHTATHHTGIDIYQCPHCPKTFKRSSIMHNHRKKVHPMEWADGRINKRSYKINLSLVSNEVVI